MAVRELWRGSPGEQFAEPQGEFVMNAVAVLFLSLVLASLAHPQPRPQPSPSRPSPQPKPSARLPALAFTRVTVIDGTDAPPCGDQTVVVIGDRIMAIGDAGAVRIPPRATRIDGRGKFLIPGLWDMHVHVSGFHVDKEQILAMCLAHGVTGVRDMGGNMLEQIQAWRREIAAGTRVGPRLVAPGPLVDGPDPSWPLISLSVTTAEEGRQAVRRLREQGVDFVKVYSRIPREAYSALAAACREQGMPFAGHLSVFVTPAEAAEAGQRSIEHLGGIGFLLSCSSRREEIVRKGSPNQSLDEILDTYSEEKAASLFARFVANGTWQVPTLTVRRAGTFLNDPEFTRDARLKYIPPATRERWKPENDFRYRNRTPEQIATRKRLYRKELELVGAMRRAGVRFMAGTDVGNPFVFPGASLHDELRLLVEAGLTPLEALQSATRNPALFLGRPDLGTVQEGRLADLVLLDANPLDEIRNTEKIAAVVTGGRLLDRSALEGLLADVESAARAAEARQ